MVALVVHSEALQRRYVAPLCSVACLLNLLLLAGAGVLPLYIAWGSGPFWLHDATRYEQPAVTFSSSLVVQLQGLRGPAAGVRLPFTAAWTTSQFANALVGSDALRAMVVRASSRDDNLDGVADEILLSAQLPLQADEVVTAATVVAYFGVQLQQVTRFQMDACLVVSAASGVAASRLDLYGDLVLQQRQSLPTTSAGIFSPYLGQGFASLDSAATVNDVLPASLLAAARARNYSLRFDVPAPQWLPDSYVPPTPSASGVPPPQAALAAYPRSFTVALRARVPAGPVWLRPAVSEELRWGWMQYLSFLVLSAAVAWACRWALFSLHLVETTVVVDAPRSATKLHLS